MTNFQTLVDNESRLDAIASNGGADGFFAQEAKRFISIAGTLLGSNFPLDGSGTADSRYVPHILTRSLIENFFRIIYIFDGGDEKESRYGIQVINSFKDDYRKMMNESLIPKTDLKQADENWKNFSGILNIKDMLAQVKNTFGDRLDYLYFIYRISSFDTHGNNLENILDTVFNEKNCNFPILKIKNAIELIADQYVCILNDINGLNNPSSR